MVFFDDSIRNVQTVQFYLLYLHLEETKKNYDSLIKRL